VKALPARVSYPKDPFPSTYKPMPSEDVLIRNATVFDGLGGEIQERRSAYPGRQDRCGGLRSRDDLARRHQDD